MKSIIGLPSRTERPEAVPLIRKRPINSFHLNIPKKDILISFAAIVAIVFLAFSPCLLNDFVNWDDPEHIKDNLDIHRISIENIRNIFTNTVLKIYIPLTSLSFAVEYHFFKDNPFIYHLDNVILHSLSAGLIFIFCLQIGLSLGAAGFAALIFGLHPIHVESVAWITERKDVLCGFFYILSLCSYLRYLKVKKITPFIFSVLFGVLSILSKPMALSLPLILLLLDWFNARKLDIKIFIEKLPYALFIGAITWITYSLHARIPGKNPIEAVLIWCWSFVFYLRSFLFPYKLSPIHLLPKPISASNLHFLIPAIIFLLLVFCIYRARKNRWLLFSFGFYFFTIFFLLRFDTAVDRTMVADRFMYIPSIGFCVLLGFYGKRIFSYFQKRRTLYRFSGFILYPSVLLALFILTFSQCKIWKDSESLWRHQITIYPSDAIGMSNLATSYGKKEEYSVELKKILLKMEQDSSKEKYSTLEYFKDKNDIFSQVIRMYQRAVEVNPEYTEAYNNLGHALYRELGYAKEAIPYFKKALEYTPKYKDARYELGHIYLKFGRIKDAIVEFEKLIGFNPDEEGVYAATINAFSEAIKEGKSVGLLSHARRETIRLYSEFIKKESPRARSYFNLGTIFSDIGEYERAINAYKMALKIDPGHAKSLYSLGNCYRKINQLDEAIVFYKKTIESDSMHEDAYLNLGITYGHLKNTEKAADVYKKLIKINPKNADAYFNLGYIYKSVGKNKEAVEAYKEAIRIDPQHSEAYFDLGNFYTISGNYPEAERMYIKAVDANPKHLNATVNLSSIFYYKNDFKKAYEYLVKAKILGYQAPAEYLEVLKEKLGKDFIDF